MGGERTGPGKHLLLHPAGLLAGWLGCLLLLLLGGGCALLRVRPAGEAWQARVERLLRQGRYQEALRSLQLAYGRFPQERDRLALEDLYRRKGFKDVVVDPAVVEAQGPEAVKISFPVTEGRRWTLESLRLENFPVEAIAVITE